MTGFLNILVLLAALQGFILSILLFRRRVNKRSNRLLGWLILLISLACLNLYLDNTHLLESNIYLRIVSWVVPLVIAMPFGPLLYFYIRTMLDPAFQLKPKHRVQFLAGIIDIVPQLTAIIYLVGLFARIIPNNPEPWGIFIDDYNKYVDIPRWLLLSVYVILAYQFLRKNNHPKKQVIVKWLKQFIAVFIAFQVIWFIYLVPYILPASGDWLLNKMDWFPIYIPLAIMIYWLGLKGYLMSQVAIDKKKKPASRDITNEMADQTINLLQKTMEEDRLYLNPDLNLEAVARHTGIVSKTISAVLNQYQQTNFNEWVNGYRIKEFKSRVQNGNQKQLTISAIATECGFNSQATFQRIFKQVQGMTPSEYLKTSQLKD